MGQNNPKITIRSVYFGMLLLSAVVMILAVRLTIASELDSLKEAAEQGDAEAQFNLGNMYSDGRGVPQNDTEAVRWFRMAAEQGDAEAQFNLGVMYDTGRGVLQNDAEAVRWFRMAAEQGDAEAQFNLGVVYDTGEGVPQNDTEAVRWFRMAADQGFAWAQVNLGYMYYTGRGVPQNDSEAVRWYRMAAEQGIAEAQFNLGLMYALGRGIPKDDVQAYAWVNIGATQIGDEKSGKLLEVIAEDMTASAITKAQNLSREYWESYGPKRDSSEQRQKFIENELLEMHAINKILKEEQCSFWFGYVPGSGVYVEVNELSDVPDERLTADHPSIRMLCERMDRAVEAEDPATVLHSAASIFEKLAKDIVDNPTIDNQPLGGFFEQYRKTSQLPDKILDYVKQVYKDRNTTPLAGHGSRRLPKITVDDAIVLAEMTKANVLSERKLIIRQTTAKENHRN